MDIKREMEKLELSTARGRRISEGREIDISKKIVEIKRNAEVRRSGYADVIVELKSIVEGNNYGIEEEELEAVEFVIEQMERLVRYTNEQILENLKGNSIVF